MNLPADVARCMNNVCIKRQDCARAVPPPPTWVRVVYSTFPDQGCTYFIAKEEK